jgi:hypothetical protein
MNESQTCKKCYKTFNQKEKKYIFVPLGYVDPITKTFISTKEWCLNCCFKIEQQLHNMS